MANLSFFGLGIMGAPMARHLIEAGHDLAVWSHTPNKAKKFAHEFGARPCETPEEAAKGADFAFLCVGDTAMSRGAILGPRGVVRGGPPNLVIVDCSTISPAESRLMGAEVRRAGMQHLDAPCTGSRPGAEAGTLTFMVGGDEQVFERTRPYFKVMGDLLYYCGGPGAGLHAKLTQNLILGVLLQAFNEGLVLSTKAGVDPALILEILNNSAARSGLISYKAPYVFARNFVTNFSLKWLEKDMGLMVDSGADLGVPLPVASLAQQLFRAAIARGYGEDDMCGSIRLLEEIAGTEVSVSREEASS